MDISELASAAAKLRPTSTVVRSRNGTIHIERANLLTECQRNDKVAHAAAAASSAASVTVKKRSEGALFAWSGTCWFASGCTPLPSHTERASPRYRVLSFNVWFSEYRWEERQDGLIDLIVRQEPDVVCLQETTQRFLRRLLENHAIRENYQSTDRGNGGTLIGNYGVAMLIRTSLCPSSVTWVTLPSAMGRRGLVVSFLRHARPLVIATVHLESLNAPKTRQLQLTELHECYRQLSTEVAPRKLAALLVGDLNISGESPHADGLEERGVFERARKHGFVDVWTESHNEESGVGLTYDTRLNKMIQRADATQPHDWARYDRALLRGAFAVEPLKVVGTEPLKDGLWISDHFGLKFTVMVSSLDDS